MNKERKLKNQIPTAIIAFLLVVSFGVYLAYISTSLGFFWITGISFGFILQRSRFCFASAIRDPYLIGGTSMTKAVLISLAITTIGFTAIRYGAYINGQAIPGQLVVTPISFATIIGSILFGIGMVLAGGCASGVLMRAGEGFQAQMVAVLFFIIGSLWGAHDYGWWDEKFISKAKSVFLPDIFGWFGALTIQLLFIAFLYVLADKWESKKSEDY